MKNYTTVIIALLASTTLQGSVPSNRSIQAEDIEKWNRFLEMGMVEYLDSMPWWDAVTATPTNIVLKPNPERPHFEVYDMSRKNEAVRYELEIPKDIFYQSPLIFIGRGAEWYVGHNEDIVLTPDREIVIGDNSGNAANMVFTPVSFKNEQKGFRMMREMDWYWLTPPLVAMNIKYLALGDEPREMTEDDVETIMEWTANEDGEYHGEWKTYEKPPPATAPEDTPSANSPPPVVITRSGTTKQSILLMGIGIVACFLAILYFLRKKSK